MLDISNKFKGRALVDIQERMVNGRNTMQINMWELDTTIPLEDQLNGTSNNRDKPTPPSCVAQSDSYQLLPDITEDLSAHSMKVEESNTSHRESLHNSKEIVDEISNNFNCKSVNAVDESSIRSVVNHDNEFTSYQAEENCAEPHAQIIRTDDIPNFPPGNCLFHSLIKVCHLKMSALELRKLLLQSPALNMCTNPAETRAILSSATEYEDADCIFIFSRTFDKNVCAHYYLSNGTVLFLHYIVDVKYEYIHLHLAANHYSPYKKSSRTDGDNLSVKDFPEEGGENDMIDSEDGNKRNELSEAVESENDASDVTQEHNETQDAITRPQVQGRREKNHRGIQEMMSQVPLGMYQS